MEVTPVAGSFDLVLAELVGLFRTNRRAAEFLGVSHTQLAAWLGGDLPSARSLERIVDAGAVVEQLRAKGLTDAAVLTELYSLWPELATRPVVLVRAGEATRVLEAVPARFASEAAAPTRIARDDLAAALRVLADAANASADALVHG